MGKNCLDDFVQVEGLFQFSFSSCCNLQKPPLGSHLQCSSTTCPFYPLVRSPRRLLGGKVEPVDASSLVLIRILDKSDRKINRAYIHCSRTLSVSVLPVLEWISERTVEMGRLSFSANDLLMERRTTRPEWDRQLQHRTKPDSEQVATVECYGRHISHIWSGAAPY